jgi:hypothetical protein
MKITRGTGGIDQIGYLNRLWIELKHIRLRSIARNFYTGYATSNQGGDFVFIIPEQDDKGITIQFVFLDETEKTIVEPWTNVVVDDQGKTLYVIRTDGRQYTAKYTLYLTATEGSLVKTLESIKQKLKNGDTFSGTRRSSRKRRRSSRNRRRNSRRRSRNSYLSVQKSRRT